MYDITIIGAGVAGSTLAYFAKKHKQKVLIIERASTAATGGSGAAGAFISPKLGKSTPLLELTNSAFKFATSFYTTYFSSFFNQTGILRLPKDFKDAINFPQYQTHIGGEILSIEKLKQLGIKSQYEGLFFKEGGVCDAQSLCNALIKGVDFLQLELKDIKFNQEITINSKIKTKTLILATGYESHPLLSYMGIRGVWGSRGDFYCKKEIPISLHKEISISANIDGVVKIGATHKRVNTISSACLSCDGAPLVPLIKEANNIIEADFKIKETFCGMRASSRDYFPVVGKVIDSSYMLNHYPQIKKGFSKVKFKYIDNLYVFNGLGGRGFVLAPLLAKQLIEHIINKKEIDKRVNPDRLFFKWARKLDKKEER